MAISTETALVYCESQFGLVNGKTTAALVRHSKRYTIVGVIDSQFAGQEAGTVLEDINREIPIFADLANALHHLPEIPDCFIYGKAPLEAFIPPHERGLILEAMQKGMNIVNGLHQFFSDDSEFIHQAAMSEIQIRDIRKSPKLEDLHVYTGRISKVNIPVVAVLGTDCACGKMTTAVELNQSLNRLGIHSVLVATGQSCLMQGAKYGVSMDALVSQFVIGEVEHAVIAAFEQEQPDIIIVEGQSSVSHPAFMSSLGILKGSLPNSVILQHPPGRAFRCDFPHLKMPTVSSEIQLIETMSPTKVIAIALSHENISQKETQKWIRRYEAELQIPTTDVLNEGSGKLVQTVLKQFPTLCPLLQSPNPDKVATMAMK